MIDRRKLLSTIALCTLVLFATTAAGYVGPAFADKGSSHDGGGNDDSGSDDNGSDDNGSDDNGSDDDGSDDDGSDDTAGDDSVDDNPGASTRNRGGRACAAGTNCSKG